MKKLTDAAAIIIKHCDKVDDLEINFSSGSADIYWENLRVDCDPKDLPKAMEAIKTLNDLGAYFE